ncbi:MAG: VWA domain-containing protein [Flavobacteriaceae bacterium]|nr:BatA domain-containing protein [Bacteroidia bacterium]NNL61491.1 VWA domain-containing protein [Flavobacteriaceae bacterium]
MQFKHPELLYALLLLLIPIIIHLFQLRRFKETPFTNVAFLKEVTLQTRKSSQLKKWLTLITRLLLLACAVLAFAQPFTSKSDTFNQERETVLYLDNSFSMQAMGSKGELMKRAVQDILTEFPDDEELTIITNNNTFRNTSLKAIRNDLLQLPYSSNQLDYDAMQFKASKMFSKNAGTIKDLVIISDFQQKEGSFSSIADSTINVNLVKLKPVNLNNAFIDSVSISKMDVNNIKLNVFIKNTGQSIENLPISLYNGDNLTAKTSISIEDEMRIQFDLPIDQEINGKIVLSDNNLQFDNEFFFNINATEKINVLSINEANDSFLNRVYTEDEFNFSSSPLSRLNYSDITNQNIIVLNELKTIPNSLITALKSFTGNGGYIIIIPSYNVNLDSYNQLFTNYNFATFDKLIEEEVKITTIQFSHPLYSGVFDKKIDNFQYPKVNHHYSIKNNSGSSILDFENGQPFLQKSSNAFIFAAPLNSENTNFKNSPLIVPTLYNIAKQSLKLPNLYYTIGRANTYDVKTEVQKDNVVKLVKDNIQVIPRQVPSASQLRLTTQESPVSAGTYNVLNENEVVKKVSYNYNRSESSLRYHDIESNHADLMVNSIPEVVEDIKSEMKINELWKWFVIFALIFLVIEMLILKYIK